MKCSPKMVPYRNVTSPIPCPHTVVRNKLQAVRSPVLPAPAPRSSHGQGWGAGCLQAAVHGAGDQPLLVKGTDTVCLPQQSPEKSGGAALFYGITCWAASRQEKERRGEQVIVLGGEQVTLLFPARALGLKNAVSE